MEHHSIPVIHDIMLGNTFRDMVHRAFHNTVINKTVNSMKIIVKSNEYLKRQIESILNADVTQQDMVFFKYISTIVVLYKVSKRDALEVIGAMNQRLNDDNLLKHVNIELIKL